MRKVKSSAFFISGELLGKIAPFALLPLLTRYLGVEAFGELSIYQAYITIIMIVVGLSQDKFILTSYYRDSASASEGLFPTVVLYVLLNVSFLLTLAFVYESKGLVVISISAGVQTLFFSSLIYLQCLNRYLLYFWVCIFQGVGGVLVTIFVFENIGVGVFERLWVVVLVNAICVCLILLFIYIKPNTMLITNIKWHLKKLLAFGGGLLVYQISVVSKGQLDRLIVADLFDKEAVGLYALTVQLSMALIVILMAINKVLTPIYYSYIKEGRMTSEKIKLFFTVALAIAPIPAAVVYLIPASTFPFVFGQEYDGVSGILVRLLLGVGLMIPYMLLLNTLLYYSMNKYISVVSMLSAIAYLVSFYLLANIDLLSATYSLAVSNVFIVILFWIKVVRLKPFEVRLI
jgi:O-antigen/teichoic acid export membrane protein